MPSQQPFDPTDISEAKIAARLAKIAKRKPKAKPLQPHQSDSLIERGQHRTLTINVTSCDIKAREAYPQLYRSA